MAEVVNKPEEETTNHEEHPVFAELKKAKPEEAIEAIRNFFELDGVSIEISDNSGMTPLMHACWKGNLDLAKFLINQVPIFLAFFSLNSLYFFSWMF